MPQVALAVVSCLVVYVSDGDTLHADCAPAGQPLAIIEVVSRSNGKTYPKAVEPVERLKIRLAQVDAPEAGQSFGAASKRNLIDLCLYQPATVRSQGVDQYGRSVARVICNSSDASAAQVGAGMAWVYDAYARDQNLYVMQEAARQARLGLWAENSPVPPWVWRKAKRTAREQ